MEYFIVAKGYVWDRVLEVLKRKAAEGVEVRFMYDGTCTVSLLPPNYPKKLEQEGIACRVFSPIRPALSTHQNNRDHRKIVVIDGKVAFTGGINLADEYVNRKIRFWALERYGDHAGRRRSAKLYADVPGDVERGQKRKSRRV